MRIFRGKSVFLGVICVFLGVILQNLPGGMPSDLPGMVVPSELPTIVTKLAPPRKFSAYATVCRARLKSRGPGAIFIGGPLWRNSWHHRL